MHNAKRPIGTRPTSAASVPGLEHSLSHPHPHPLDPPPARPLLRLVWEVASSLLFASLTSCALPRTCLVSLFTLRTRVRTYPLVLRWLGLRASVGLFLWVFIILTRAPRRGSQVCGQTQGIENQYRRLYAGHTTTLLMVVQRCTGVPVVSTGWILR